MCNIPSLLSRPITNINMHAFEYEPEPDRTIASSAFNLVTFSRSTYQKSTNSTSNTRKRSTSFLRIHRDRFLFVSRLVVGNNSECQSANSIRLGRLCCRTLRLIAPNNFVGDGCFRWLLAMPAPSLQEYNSTYPPQLHSAGGAGRIQERRNL